MDEFGSHLRNEMQGEHAPPDGHRRLMARVRRRERGRRLAAGGLGLALTGLLAVAGYATLHSGQRVDGPVPPASDGPTPSSASADPSPSPTTSASSEPTDGPLPDSPPPVTVRFFDRSLELFPYTYCYRTGCVAGAPGDLPDIGAPEHVTVEFPLDSWSFTAFFRPAGDECGRVQSTPLTETYWSRSFVLEPAGYSDTYDVTLFGEAEEGGDLFVAFRWTTPTDGPLPESRAYLALLSNDDPVTSYGVELHVSNLASTPSSKRAIITVRASNGREITFEAKEADRDCLPEGTVFWDGPDAKGLAAAELG
ncbi:MAG: hypothetical protein HY658_14815, partial [Actinobacteria bacterium]|nr:hypothetical protein [Actinomycetota bacterium]